VKWASRPTSHAWDCLATPNLNSRLRWRQNFESRRLVLNGVDLTETRSGSHVGFRRIDKSAETLGEFRYGKSMPSTIVLPIFQLFSTAIDKTKRLPRCHRAIGFAFGKSGGQARFANDHVCSKQPNAPQCKPARFIRAARSPSRDRRELSFIPKIIFITCYDYLLQKQHEPPNQNLTHTHRSRGTFRQRGKLRKYHRRHRPISLCFSDGRFRCFASC